MRAGGAFVIAYAKAAHGTAVAANSTTTNHRPTWRNIMAHPAFYRPGGPSRAPLAGWYSAVRRVQTPKLQQRTAGQGRFICFARGGGGVAGTATEFRSGVTARRIVAHDLSASSLSLTGGQHRCLSRMTERQRAGRGRVRTGQRHRRTAREQGRSHAVFPRNEPEQGRYRLNNVRARWRRLPATASEKSSLWEGTGRRL
jgi:hypothetical protein